jgi:hypothetical protein
MVERTRLISCQTRNQSHYRTRRTTKYTSRTDATALPDMCHAGRGLRVNGLAWPNPGQNPSATPQHGPGDINGSHSIHVRTISSQLYVSMHRASITVDASTLVFGGRSGSGRAYKSAPSPPAVKVNQCLHAAPFCHFLLKPWKSHRLSL